jgi:CRP/FNR family cyclic AMP-dependent transcriptional regulator
VVTVASIFFSREAYEVIVLAQKELKEMCGSHRFDLNENGLSCKLHATEFFRHLGAAALTDFDALKTIAMYPQGAVLFLEKQKPSGVFVLCSGEVKLSINSVEGKTLTVRIAGIGELLGLTATLSGSTYEVTAEALRSCQVALVRGDAFLRFVAAHPEAYRGAVAQLMRLYTETCDQLRTVGLSTSVPKKLARLLLDRSSNTKNTKQGISTNLSLTHEEIAECIGTCRESVTRTLSEFKRQRLVARQGSALRIHDRSGLEAIGSR